MQGLQRCAYFILKKRLQLTARIAWIYCLFVVVADGPEMLGLGF